VELGAVVPKGAANKLMSVARKTSDAGGPGLFVAKDDGKTTVDRDQLCDLVKKVGPPPGRLLCMHMCICLCVCAYLHVDFHLNARALARAHTHIVHVRIFFVHACMYQHTRHMYVRVCKGMYT